MKKIALFICLCLFSFMLYAQNKTDDILGTWLVQDGTLKVRVAKSGSNYSGLIVWMKDPNENGSPRLDKYNPDESKRINKVVNQTFMFYNLKFDGKDTWEGGHIYDWRTGKVYGCKLSMNGKNILKVRGFVSVSLLGQTNNWTRVENTLQ